MYRDSNFVCSWVCRFDVSVLVVEDVIPESLIRERFCPVGTAMVISRRKGPVPTTFSSVLRSYRIAKTFRLSLQISHKPQDLQLILQTTSWFPCKSKSSSVYEGRKRDKTEALKTWTSSLVVTSNSSIC